MRTKTLSLLALVAIICLSAASLRAATISIQPVVLPVTAGQVFTLSVNVSGVTDLYGYQFDLGFNPGVLSAVSVTEGPFLATGGSTFFFPGTIDNIGGSIPNNADILLTAVSGEDGGGRLLDVTFKALSPGSSNITIFNVIALGSLGEGLNLTAAGGTVNVSPASISEVPEPSSVLLLTTGVLGLYVLLEHLQAKEASSGR